jgi:ubiquinone biosynthesis UbiH/UbiF/VisC/COQ6 family hydroxylase
VNRADHRIAIIGGGLVGSVCALQLKQLGFAVTLFERNVPTIIRGPLGLDIRNVSLSPASQAQLDEVGVWDQLDPAPYRRMEVWEEWGTSEIVFDATDVGRQQLGWVVENGPLQSALWQRLGDAGVTMRVGAINHLDFNGPVVNIRVAGGGDCDDSIEVDFVIGADGANSVVRKAMGVALTEYPIQQAALATVVRTEQPHEDTSRQRFLQDGPLALLPAPQADMCSVVWSQSPAQAAHRAAQSERDFCRDLAHAFEYRLGEIQAVDRRMVFPLTQQCVKSCAPHARVLLIGDAMRVIHPLAGLGVNLGLEDVRGLVSVAATQSDLATDVWGKFARQRQIRSQMMIRAMALLRSMYANPSPTFGWLRNIGVKYLDRRGWVKQQIMREALGLGPVARLSA